MLPEYTIIFTTALSFFGGLMYVVQTLKGKTKPNRVTWLLWTLAPMIAFSAQLSKGVGISLLLTFIVGFNPLLVLIASFINRKSFWKISRLDILCGIISFGGIIGWVITREGNVAIVFSILADGIAGLPTIIKSIHFPDTEDYRIYFFGLINAIVTILTLKTYDIAHLAFPLYILLINLLLTLLIRFKLGKKVPHV